MSDFDEEPSPEDLAMMQAKMDELEELTRKLGLYMENASVVMFPTAFGPKLAILSEFVIGDVAFTQRIQDPEQDQVDRQFHALTHDIVSDEFLSRREQLKRNIAAGRKPFDNGTD